MAHVLGGWDLDFTQLTPGSFRGAHRVQVWPGVLLQEGFTDPSLVQCGGGPSQPTFCVLAEEGLRMIFRGRVREADSITVVRPGDEIHARTDAAFHVYTLTVEESLLRSAAQGTGVEQAVDACLAARGARCSISEMRRLRRALTAATDAHALVQALLRALASSGCESAVSDLRGLDRVAVRLSRVLDARPSEALSVGWICDAVGVSERTLRRAVQAWYGVPPKQLVRARRLRGARRALEVARPAEAAVTGVAHAWGFAHLGRFAGDYRALFGELPSETLARPRRPHLPQVHPD